MVKKTDRSALGCKNSIPLEPYLKWVQARAQNLMMPYATILLVISESVDQIDEPRIIFHPDMPISFKELQNFWIQIKEE